MGSTGRDPKLGNRPLQCTHPQPNNLCAAQHIVLYDMGSGSTVVALVRYSSYNVKEGGKPKPISQLEVGTGTHGHFELA